MQGEIPLKLAAIKIARLLAPGKTMELSRDLVALKIRDARVGAPLVISGTVTVVTASSRLVKGDDVRAFAEKYLRERLAPLSSSAEIDFSFKDSAVDFVVPDRPVTLDLAPPAGGRFRGNVVLRVIARQTAEDGSEIQVGHSVMSCLVKIRQKQLVALKAIRRGELISAANVGLAMVDTTYQLDEGYSGIDEVAGLKAKTYIGADKAVTALMLERPPVIRRGDIVTLVVRSGLVSVNVAAKAMRDAAVGDSIPVEISQSKKQVQGRVMDERTVVSESR